MGNWHRRATGHYVRKRGSIYDHVKRGRRGNKSGWLVFIGEDGGKKVFPSRLVATSALDGWISSKRDAPADNSVKDNPGSDKYVDDKGDQTCDACNGSGKYYGHGHVLNGVFQGFIGKCFRCDGKGHQNAEDRKRNWGYDQNRVIRI